MHTVAGGHKLPESTERSFATLVNVSNTSEPRTDPNRWLANMLKVNNIWTPLLVT